MAANEIAAAAFAAARQAQFAPALDGVDLWVWSSPSSPDLNVLVALALQAAGNDVLASIRLERSGLQFAVGQVLHLIPWGALGPVALGQIADLRRLQAEVVEERARAAAASLAPAQLPEPEAGDDRTIH